MCAPFNPITLSGMLDFIVWLTQFPQGPVTLRINLVFTFTSIEVKTSLSVTCQPSANCLG